MSNKQASIQKINHGEYVIPDFKAVLNKNPNFSKEKEEDKSGIIEFQLEAFKAPGKVTKVTQGPVVTRYEVLLNTGVKVNKVTSLGSEMAMALKVQSVHISPVPGTSCVGIEVPNVVAESVYLRDVLESDTTQSPNSLKIALGKTVNGSPATMDLTKAPHLLIAGQTGSGKSVCMHSIITSLLLSKTPDELQLILIDPKQVELAPYASAPHVYHGAVISNPSDAIHCLNVACEIMERRYSILAAAGVRNIETFNQNVRDGKYGTEIGELHYIVIVIDELADLMMASKKEVEHSIVRIAQKARAIGIHLVVATQRPTVGIITGTIKANMPSRIAFKVASGIDARTIMDGNGAESLVGRGDMLLTTSTNSEPVRIQGTYVSESEVDRVVAACSEHGTYFPRNF